jgi:hypothetical protein
MWKTSTNTVGKLGISAILISCNIMNGNILSPAKLFISFVEIRYGRLSVISVPSFLLTSKLNKLQRTLLVILHSALNRMSSPSKLTFKWGGELIFILELL